MNIEQFLNTLKTTPNSINFETTMEVIDRYFTHTPSGFHNGNLYNSAEQNQGSCKLLAFAKNQQLTPQQTLDCFGQYYREDVLEHPQGDNHQNIRNFMKSGWAGVKFDQEPLTPKMKS